MATQEKTWNVANRLHSQKDSDNPEVNHIIAGADEIYDDEKGANQSDINAQVDAALSDRYTKEETYNRDEIESLVDPTNYVSVVATNLTTAVTDLLPAEGATDTIYRIGNWNGTQYDPIMYALYAWNGSAYVCLAVRSFVGEVYDVSVNHPDGQGNPTPYADLDAALGTNGANIPADIRRGGMSIKFIQGTIQSSDNKYIQARCMAQNFTTDVTQWQGVDDEPTAGSENLIKSGGSYKSLIDINEGIFTKELFTDIYEGKYYNSGLVLQNSPKFNAKKIDISVCKSLKFRAALRGSAAISLTDSNDNILWQADSSNLPSGISTLDLSLYNGAKYLYFCSCTAILLLDDTFVNGIIIGIPLYDIKDKIEAVPESLDLSEVTPVSLKRGQKNLVFRENRGTQEIPDWNIISNVILPAATKEEAGLMSAEDKSLLGSSAEENIDIILTDGTFYRNDLSQGNSASFNCAIVALSETSNFDGIIVGAAPRSGGYCSLVDSNSNILWQSNNADDFPKTLNFSDYPTANKMYVSNEKSVIASPYVKYYKNFNIQEQIDNIEDDIEIIRNALTLQYDNAKKEIIPNSFDASNVIAFPEDFGAFGIPIQISRIGSGLFGWSINPFTMQKDNSQTATYYVSPDGDDGNDGLSTNTALKTIDIALSKSDVNTIILTDGVFVNGINFTSGLEINKEINILGVVGRTIIKSSSGQAPIKIVSPVYVSDIVFYGGTAALKTNLAEELCVFNRCKFLNSSSTNGIDCLGGKYIFNECEASGNMRDGFNYHGSTINNISYKPQVVEINCYGFDNGLYHNSYINNGSTIHENGSKIIRLYCKYGTSKGVVVADADGCRAINYGVTSYSTQNLDGDDNRKSCFGSQGSGTKVWLYNCSAFGSKYDIIVDANSYIYRTGQFAKEYAAEGGVIDDL